MKRLIIINTTTHRETPRSAKQKLDEIFKEYIPKKYISHYTEGWMYPFEEDSPHIQELLDFAKANNIPCEFLHNIYFTKTELEKMPFFKIRLPYPLELEGMIPFEFGTKYKDRCEECGFWTESVNEMLIDRKFMKRWKIASADGHNFLTEDIKRIFDENGLTGINYIGDVKDYKGRDMEPFKLFSCYNVLPPVAESMNLKKYGFPCKKCGFDTTYLLQPLEYEREKLDGALDFNYTYEYCNNDRARQIVVSAKVKKVFRENKIFAIFDPILLLD